MSHPDATQISMSARAKEKEASRCRDEKDLASGRKSAAQLRRENEVFGQLASSARVRIIASRSLG
jgi:hypothetical protein